MSAASNWVHQLIAGGVTAPQLEVFASLLASTQDAAERCEALTFFLRAAAPGPEQVITLAKSSAVRDDLALLQLLKRHARSQEFAASNAFEKARLSGSWAPAHEFLRAVTGLVPPSYKRRNAP